MKNRNPWPLALIILFTGFCVITVWSVFRAVRSPGSAVVKEYLRDRD